MSDSSSSHIAELLMQGTNMGIIEGRRLLNTKDINKDIHKLLKEYINMQEDAIEVLKTFL
jgi:O-phosphoseryl-tRNA(Cys) synthetase